MGYALQSNTTKGAVAKVANGAISAGYLVKLDTTGKVTAISAVTDRAMFVALEDAVDGASVQCQPLSAEGNIRVVAGTVSGTQNAGVAVYLAAAPAADGRINESSANSAIKVGYAEEQFVTGQWVLIRPIPAS